MKQGREAHKQSNRKHYANNREKVLAAVQQRKQENIQRFQEYKATLSCIRCGFSHPAALDFHHRNPAEKRFIISRQAQNFGWRAIMEEITKCDVLCKNCHAIHHYEERLTT